MMLTLEECKNLICDSTFSDEEVLAIRNACYELANITAEYMESLKEDIPLENESIKPGHWELDQR